jgi:hypothetical protein
MSMMKLPFGGSKSLVVEDEVEETRAEAQVGGENSLFLNPIMRGFLRFSNRLQEFNFMDPKHVENELEVKLRVCNVFERLLDLRQNFLL